MVLLTTAPVDVSRPAALTAWAVAAGVAGTVAAGATFVLIAVLVGRWRHRPFQRQWATTAWTVAVAASLTELALRLVDLVGTDAVLSVGGALIERRVVATLARVVLLGVVAALERFPGVLSAAETRVVEAIAGLLLVGTVLLDSPRAGWDGALAVNAGLTAAALLVAVWFATALHDRRPDLRAARGTVLVPLVVAGALTVPVITPPASYTSVSQYVDYDEGRFNLTVAPATPGGNELHIYVFDAAGEPVTVVGGAVTVAGASTPLRRAGGPHLLAYGLQLPATDGWTMRLEVDTSDGRTLTATTEVPAQ